MSSKFLKFTFLLLISLLWACKKDEKEKAIVNIYITDAPADFKSVQLAFTAVEFIFEGEKTEKIELDPQAAINLLNYTNGRDTLLASFELRPGFLAGLKLFMGPNNTLTTFETTHDIIFAGNIETGFTNLIGDSIEGDKTYNYHIDFDLFRSIQKPSQGTYVLKPCFRVFVRSKTGSIIGQVMPDTIRTYVSIFSNTDTLGTIANSRGQFRIIGVPPGIYALSLKQMSKTEPAFIIPDYKIKVDSTETVDAGRFLLY